MRLASKVTIATLAAMLVFASSEVQATLPAASQPNIVLILVDDVGRDLLSCYGGQSHQTPQLDRLAAEGMRFEHAYVMPVCHPTRTTLLTGQYPFRLGRPKWGTFPPTAENRTLPQLLKQAGYATAVAGKWQLALLKDDLQQPHRMGFDEYCLLGWHEGPWYHRPLYYQNGRRRNDVADRYGPDVDNEFIIEFIRQNRGRPFFAFYSMSLCHSETNDLPQPAPFGPGGRYESLAEMVAAMDERVGRVVKALSDLGLRERTLVLFLTDNGTAKNTIVTFRDGEYVTEPNVNRIGGRDVEGGKATLTDWGTRVPLITNWPGTIEPKQVSDTLVDASDLLPTVVELVGARLPSGVAWDGRSFAPLVRGQPFARREWVFAEHDGKSFVKDRRWKLFDDGRLFDLESDPDEKHALAIGELSPAAKGARDRLQGYWPH